MTKEEVRARIIDVGIVPVVRAPSAQLAAAAARAVVAGGIPIVEITMTVPDAVDLIRKLSDLMSDSVLIGAGTVLDADTAARCFDAGAQFMVSPILDVASIQLAQTCNKLTMAGGLTPNEVVDAWKAGTDFVKIFPCGSVGGAAHIKSLKAALPQIPMIPTGGVSLATAASFLEAGASALGVGGEMISASAIASGNFEAITKTAAQYAELVRAARR